MSAELATVGILASGDRENNAGGSTMNRFIRDVYKKEMPIKIGVIVCNNPRGTVGVYDKIDAINADFGTDLEVLTINGVTHPGRKQEQGQTLDESAEIYKQLMLRGVTDVLCLGYMKIVTGDLMAQMGWWESYADSEPNNLGIYMSDIVNTHPGILPETANTHGEGASAKVLELGLPRTAHTLHVMGAGIDTGPTFKQNFVDVRPDDTAESLFKRVQDAEKDNIAQDMLDYYQAKQDWQASELSWWNNVDY